MNVAIKLLTPPVKNTQRIRHGVHRHQFCHSISVGRLCGSLSRLSLFLLVIVSSAAFANRSETIAQPEHYEDPAGLATLAQLTSSSHSPWFKPLSPQIYLSANNTHWIRLKVAKTSQYPFIRLNLRGEHSLDAYLSTASGSVFSLPKVEPISIPFNHTQYFLELPRTTQPAIVLIKLKTSVSTSFDPVFVSTHPRLGTGLNYVLSGLLIAGMLLLIFSNNYVGYTHKKGTLVINSTMLTLLLTNNSLPFIAQQLAWSSTFVTSAEWATILIDFMTVGLCVAVSTKLIATMKTRAPFLWFAHALLGTGAIAGMIGLPVMGEINGQTFAHLLLGSTVAFLTLLMTQCLPFKRLQAAFWWFASWMPVCALMVVERQLLPIRLTQTWPWLAMSAWTLFVVMQFLFVLALHRVATQSQQLNIQASAKHTQQQLDFLMREHAKTETLAANMGYELREPLNSIVGAIDQLKDTISSTPDNLAAMGILHRGSLRLQMLVDELVDYRDIEEGHLKGAHRCFHLGDMLEQVLQTFADQAEQRGLKLRTRFGEDVPPFVIGDEFHLKQLLRSLVDNAIKFTPQGRVDIQINVNAYNHRTRHVDLQFLVKDTGIGIPEHCSEQVFGRFERVDHPEHRRYSGLGLGMYTAKIMATHLGGELGYSSVLNNGTEFKFEVSMPYVDVPDNYDPVNISRQATLNTELFTVLIVEDNPSSQMIIRMMVEKLGYRTQVASSAKEALDIIEQQPPHLILMDCQMPEMDGYEATQAIRDMPTPASQIPILAVTAEAGAQARQRCQEAGMNSYLQKPVRIHQLEKKVAQLLLQAKFIRGKGETIS